MLVAGSARAEDPVLEFSAGGDVLQFSPEEIIRADVFEPSEGGSIADFSLGEEAGYAFSDFTGDAVGELLTVRICGSVVNEITIQSALSGSLIWIPDLEPDRARHIALVLSGERSCGDVDW